MTWIRSWDWNTAQTIHNQESFNILEVKAQTNVSFRKMEPKKGTIDPTGILESGDMKLD